MDWDQVWSTLTSDSVKAQTISIPQATTQQVDVLNLSSTLEISQQPHKIFDIDVDPTKDMRIEAYRAQARYDIGKQDPTIVIGAPPCTVFSSMQNIQKAPPNPRMGQEMCGRIDSP